MRTNIEILAPAGSLDSMRAAVSAGADAVYMGGSRFGARAYADNPSEDGLLSAIDYVHLHGVKLYMTVNTLVKTGELSELFDFLHPYYLRGLDAAIVQDYGVLRSLRGWFPDLRLHASTQMTVTGWRGAALLEEQGVSRVVPARELSLSELAEIRARTSLEIETFIHGALCYCYSGQCLMSSLIGGRSGNRGRCAQPCRLPYRSDKGKQANLLSLRDLCTLDILPDILEAGVTSLKIEGRMKSPRYTAGVVSIYRKYVDLYLRAGREGYRTDPADRRFLLALFDRGGFTDGYYGRHNGRDMIALKEKPAFRQADQAVYDQIDADYVKKEKKEAVSGVVRLAPGQPAGLCLRTVIGGRTYTVRAEGCTVLAAQNQPVTEEKLLRQMKKTGDSPFVFSGLTARIEGAVFLPVSSINQLRRDAFALLQEEIVRGSRRPEADMKKTAGGGRRQPARVVKGAADSGCRPRLHVSLEDPASLAALLANPDIDEICLESTGFSASSWREATAACHAAGKACALIFPRVFRAEAERWFQKNLPALRAAGFDEFVLDSLEEVMLLRGSGLSGIPAAAGPGLYAMNPAAADFLADLGFQRISLPLELNSRELGQLGCADRELFCYGYLPVMFTAQCLRKTLSGCTKKQEVLKLADRTGRKFTVKNHCRFCFNTIYNTAPLSLLGQEEAVRRLSPAVLRLAFTMESPKEAAGIAAAFAAAFLHGEKVEVPFSDFTRGHFKRGVE